MSRRKIIDRNKVLEAAEGIVAAYGASGLTFEAVATAAGITKGGVQSCFGSKEGIIEAMLRRWAALYEADIDRRVGPDASPLERARAHVQSTAEADDPTNARSGALLAALLQSPAYLKWVRTWYAERLGVLNEVEGPEAARARIAFLATEGLFFLRYFGLMDMSSEHWKRQFTEVSAIMPSEEPGGGAPGSEDSGQKVVPTAQSRKRREG